MYLTLTFNERKKSAINGTENLKYILYLLLLGKWRVRELLGFLYSQSTETDYVGFGVRGFQTLESNRSQLFFSYTCRLFSFLNSQLNFVVSTSVLYTVGTNVNAYVCVR